MSLVKIKSLIPCHAPSKNESTLNSKKEYSFNIILSIPVISHRSWENSMSIMENYMKEGVPLATHFTSRFLSQQPARLKSHWLEWKQITPKPVHLRLEVRSQRIYIYSFIHTHTHKYTHTSKNIYIHSYIYIYILSFHFVYSNSLIKLTFTKNFIGK